MKAQDTYVELVPLLAEHWDKSLAELPEELRARVGHRTNKILVGYRPKMDAHGNQEIDAEGIPLNEEVFIENRVGAFIVEWDSLDPDQRRQCAAEIDLNKSPRHDEEREYFFDLSCKQYAIEDEIKRWELMGNQLVPSEAKIQGDKLDELRAELESIKMQWELPAPAAKVEEATEPPAKSKKELPAVWWRTDYDIMAMAQSAGDSLRRREQRTSNISIGGAVALEIERREKLGKKRPAPDGQTIKNTDLLGWKYQAE